MNKETGSIEQKRRSGILYQIYVFAVLGLIVISLCTFFSQHQIAKDGVRNQMQSFMDNVATDTISSIKEYPSYEWLMRYWYEHPDELDLEYDVDYRSGTRTEQKVNEFSKRHPDLPIKYVDVSDLNSFSAEDQKLYAEIVYSWMTTRFNQIKQDYKINFLFCLATDSDKGKAPYQNQFFLLSGADPGAVRGLEYEQVYPLGKLVSVRDNRSMQKAMRRAVEGKDSDDERSYSADAGKYMDYYAYVCDIDDQAVLIGLTYDLSAILSDVRNQTLQGAVYAIAYQVVLLAILMLLLYFCVIRPLRKVQRNIRLYTRTKESISVIGNLTNIRRGLTGFITRRNEIGLLSDDVTALAKEIDDYLNQIETISAEKERIEVELELAARIQRNMLPTAFPEREEFDLCAVMEPAKVVGGDFYDFFAIDEDHIGVAIADVSGKGIPAALFMMVSKTILRNVSVREKNPARALEAANREINENNDEEMFVTVWLGILELSTGKLTAANAGHEYPAYRRKDGSFRLLHDRHGFVLGAMDELMYTDYTIQMEPGDKIFVYTDGLAEAADSERNMFGTDRMIEALQTREDGSPKEILQAVSDSVQNFVGDVNQFDDLTMLCVEYRGPKDN